MQTLSAIKSIPHHLQVVGSVGPETTGKLEKAITKIPSGSESVVLVSSNGGSLPHIKLINDILNEGYIIHHGVGGFQVFSAALPVLFSCATLSAFSNTKFLIHRVCNPDGTESLTNEYFDVEKQLFSFCAKRIGRHIDLFYRLADEKRELNAYDAKELNLIDEIIDVEFTPEIFHNYFN